METRGERHTERWALKCRRCGHFSTREVQITTTTYPATYYLGSYRSGSTVVRVDGTRYAYPRVVCPQCGDYKRDGERAIMAAKRINGRHNPNVPCDSRCTGAKGHQCECSCGGANHGIDHGAC